MAASAPKPNKKWKNKELKQKKKRDRLNIDDIQPHKKARTIPKPQPPVNKRKASKRDKKRAEREAQEFPGLVDIVTSEAESLTPGVGILEFLGDNKQGQEAATEIENELIENHDSGFISLDADDETTELGKRFVAFEEGNKRYTNKFPCPWLSSDDEDDYDNADSSEENGNEHNDIGNSNLDELKEPIKHDSTVEERNTKKRRKATKQPSKYVGEQIGTEVLEFLKHMSPSANEVRMREGCLARLRRTVHQLWPNATVSVFGSYATGMYLPDADMDVVILSNEMRANLRSEMYRLSSRLKSHQLADKIQVISHARVPIIKYVESSTGLNIDIAFGQQGGLETVSLVSTWLNENRVLKPLAMVIRQFLKRRGLSDVANGGLGGYATICMVYSRLQQRLPEVASDPLRNVGILLLDFFDYYGHRFDNVNQIVRPQRPPNCFPIPKRRNGSMTTPQASGLAIEDPNDVSNNISKASYNYVAVKRSFANAADYMKALCLQWQQLPKSTRGQLSFLAPLMKFSGMEKKRQKAMLSDALSVTPARPTPSQQHQQDMRRNNLRQHGGVNVANGPSHRGNAAATAAAANAERQKSLKDTENTSKNSSEERGKGVNSYDPWKEIYTRTVSTTDGNEVHDNEDHEEQKDLKEKDNDATKANDGKSTNAADQDGLDSKAERIRLKRRRQRYNRRQLASFAGKGGSGPERSEASQKSGTDDEDNDSRTKLTTAQRRRQFWTRKAGTQEAAQQQKE